MLSFADGSHYNLNLFTILFLLKRFIYTKIPKTQSILCKNVFKAQILRALLSNKNAMLHFEKANNSIATQLRASLLNNHF